MLSRTRIRVPGMRTAEATRLVSDALVTVQGVADIGVNPEEGLVEIRYDSGKTNPDAMRAALRAAGFRPV